MSQSTQDLEVPQKEGQEQLESAGIMLDEKNLKKLNPEQEKNKPTFSRLLHQPEIYERLSKVAKGLNRPVNKFLKILLHHLCTGTLKWSGVVVISFGLLQFGSVFMYDTFQHDGKFHTAILATHEKMVIPEEMVFNPKNMELYRTLQKTLLTVVTNNDIMFVTDDHAKFKSQKGYKIAQQALRFNTAYAIAQHCETIGTPAMQEVADECYRWILRNSVQGRSTLIFQTKEFSSFVDLCSPRFLDSLKNKFGMPAQPQLPAPQVQATVPAEQDLPRVEEHKTEEPQTIQEQQGGSSI